MHTFSKSLQGRHDVGRICAASSVFIVKITFDVKIKSRGIYLGDCVMNLSFFGMTQDL